VVFTYGAGPHTGPCQLGARLIKVAYHEGLASVISFCLFEVWCLDNHCGPNEVRAKFNNGHKDGSDAQ
jgi:hypothetical protein